MESPAMNIIARVRRNYNLLLFLMTTAIPLALWEALIILAAFVGPLYDDPNELGTALFLTCAFPLVAAPILSALALFIVKLLNISGLRWAIVVGLGGVIPLVAVVWVYIARLIALALYSGDKENVPPLISDSNVVEIKMPRNIREDPSEKIIALKKLLDRGLITQYDYEKKKAEILSKM